MKNVSIFVDVQNIYYTTRSIYESSFNYRKFWALATKERNVVNAYAYAIDRGDEKQRQFQDILRNIGFQVKLKPYIKRSDGSAKGDWDVGITIDMMESAAQSDVMVLASGDGDFDLLVSRINTQHGIPIEVYGVPALTASSLINAATTYYPIDTKMLL